ncbi:MAG: hypothetical protein L6R36_007876 [Xanthoria steineri]|nr:MAG: hypothetical protein L6R36_007876 [Xanthoria steineri]
MSCSASAWWLFQSFGSSITVRKRDTILFNDVMLYLATAEKWRSQVVDTTLDPRKLCYLPMEGLHLLWKERILFKRASIGEETEYITFWSVFPLVSEDDWGPRLMQECRKLGRLNKGTLVFTAGQKHGRQRGFSPWREISNRPKQSLDMWIGQEGVRADIQDDLRHWREEEDYYHQVHRIYKRCYCFSGPAGTGKNTCVFAIAGELDLPIFSINVTTMSDTEIAEILPDLPDRCIIFLEEVDTAFKDFNDETRRWSEVGMTRSLLHSFLDGSLTLSGKLIILTVNDFKVLGDTATRPGRIDRHFVFTLTTKPMAKEFFIQFMRPRYKQQEDTQEWRCLQDLAEEFAEKVGDGQYSPARIASFLTVHRNPYMALRHLKDLTCPEKQG